MSVASSISVFSLSALSCPSSRSTRLQGTLRSRQTGSHGSCGSLGFAPLCISSRGGMRASWVVRAEPEIGATEALERGKGMFRQGDRMGALRVWEAALDQFPTPEQRKELLYSMTCVHASFGDVELAKMTVREAVSIGLDWPAAVERADYLPLEASTQVKIQLRNFADQVVRGAKQRKDAPVARSSAPPRPSGVPVKPAAPSARQRLSDLSGSSVEDLVGTTMADGMDVSVGGVVRRVAILLVVLIGGGVALYFWGLQYLMAT